MLTVTCRRRPAGLAIDPDSVIRNFQNTMLPSMFAVSGATGADDASVTVTLDTAVAPTETARPTRSISPCTLSAAITSSETVTLAFTTNPWSFTDSSGIYTPVTLSSTQTATANSQTYLDVTFQPAIGGTLDTAAITGASSAPFTLSAPGVAVLGSPINLDPSSTGTGPVTFRYFVDGSFTPGTVTVNFTALSFSDTTTDYMNLASSSSFTVTGPTADLVNPGDSGTIGQAVIDERGFIDVPFNVPAGATLATASIIGAGTLPFTLGGTDAAAGRLQIDTSQPPVFIGMIGSAYIFRYWTIGTLTSSNVSVTFAANAYSYTNADGTAGENIAATVTPVNPSYSIGGSTVATPDIGYLDVRFTPTTGDQLDFAAIESAAQPPFTLGGSGLGTIALVPFATLAPTLLSSNVVRFYVTGAYAPGPVTLSFAAGSFQSVTLTGVSVTNPLAPTGSFEGAGNGELLTFAPATGSSPPPSPAAPAVGLPTALWPVSRSTCRARVPPTTASMS